MLNLSGINSGTQSLIIGDSVATNCSFEADFRDTGMDISDSSPGTKESASPAHFGINTQSCIPDFTIFALQHCRLSH